MKFLTIVVSIAPTLSFVHLKTSTFTSTQIASTQTAPTQTAVTNTPTDENWWKPDLSIEQDLGHAHGDNSARSLEVTGSSKAPLVSQSPPSPGFGQVASAGPALESGSASIGKNDSESQLSAQLSGLDFDKAKQQLNLAKDKVSRLRDELKARTQQHGSMEQQLKNELRTQQESFSNRNSQLNTEFEEYKIQSDQGKILIRNKIDEREKEITKAAEDRQNILREKIQGLETNLGTVRNEVEGAKMRAVSITIQRDELKKTLTEMKQRYNVDSKEWEGLLEEEQTSWKNEKEGVDKVMQGLMNEHSEKLNQAHNDACTKSESIRSELRKQLFEKEVLLQKTEVALELTEFEEKDLEEKVNQMEREKESLVSLGRQSISVLRKGFLDTMAGKDKGF